MVSPILFDTSPKKNNILNNSSNNQKVEVTKPILFGDVKPTDTDTDRRLT